MKNIVWICVLTLVLGGCTAVVPKDPEIENMVREHLLSDGLGELFKLENFAKTNGFRQSDNVYVVDVEYDLVFQKSFIDVVREIRANPTGPQYGVFGSKLVLTAIQSNFGQFDVGDRIKKSEKLILHNTEKGWQLAE